MLCGKRFRVKNQIWHFYFESRERKLTAELPEFSKMFMLPKILKFTSFLRKDFFSGQPLLKYRVMCLLIQEYYCVIRLLGIKQIPSSLLGCNRPKRVVFLPNFLDIFQKNWKMYEMRKLFPDMQYSRQQIVTPKFMSNSLW